MRRDSSKHLFTFHRSTSLLALLACFTALPLTAQMEPSAQFGDLVEVSEVLLDVLVTDTQGNVVVGLEPDDFVIMEAEQEKSATGVSFYSNRFQLREDQTTRIQKPLPNEVPADRHFILFFHDQKTLDDGTGRLLRQQLEATRQAERWVKREMLQGDWVSVVSYDHKLKIQTDFTQSREALLRAIKNAARGKDPGNIWASRRPGETTAGPSLLAHLPEGKALRNESEQIYDGMSLIAEATRDIIGRKSLLLFTIGFGRLEGAGASSFSDPSRSNTFFNSAVSAQPDERFYPDLKQSLNDNNVAVYPIDLTPNEFEHIQADFLTLLANDTGGRYYENFVNFMTPISQIADENNGYYLLSYQAEHPAGERGYREVVVTTRNPEFKVRARKGYRFGA